MAAMTDYLENQVADHIFRTGTFTAPTTIYIALFTTATSDDGTGTEVTGGSYARVQVGPGDSSWNGTHGTTTGSSSGTGGLIDNAAVITFPTATGSWGTITHFGIYDAATSGNMLFHGALSASKTIGTNDTFTFPAGDLDVTFA